MVFCLNLLWWRDIQSFWKELCWILYFDNINGFLRITAKTEQIFIIGFPKSLCPILGMYDYPEGEESRIVKADNYHMFAVKKDSLYEAPQPTDIYKLYPGVMICYANFVQHSIIGDKFYPIPRIIPTIKTKWLLLYPFRAFIIYKMQCRLFRQHEDRIEKIRRRPDWIQQWKKSSFKYCN